MTSKFLTWKESEITKSKPLVDANAKLRTDKGFNYQAILSNETRGKLKYYEKQIRTLHKKATDSARDIGLELAKLCAEAHDLLVEKRVFGAWIDMTTGMDRTYVHRLIRVYHFIELNKLDASSYDLSALVLLTEPNTPVKAIEESVTAAKKGRYVSHALAREVVKSHTPKSKKYKPKSVDAIHGSVCPVCECSWWRPSVDYERGFDCDNCGHPLGEPSGEDDAKLVMKDHQGTDVPPQMRETFGYVGPLYQTTKLLDSMMQQVDSVPRPIRQWMQTADILNLLAEAKRLILVASPSVMCPVCEGNREQRQDCMDCRSSGYLPAWAHLERQR